MSLLPSDKRKEQTPKMTYSLNWDLDSIFSGGSTSTQLQERMSQLDAQIKTYRTNVSRCVANPTMPLKTRGIS